MAAGRVREPYAALIGFYPADPEELRRAIEASFLDTRLGPGRLPGPPGSSPLEPLGGVAPHAGYSYSGPAAAHLYLALAESGYRPDTVVIIGTNHTGRGGLFTTTSYWSAWRTPLGDIPVDIEMVEELQRLYPSLVDDPSAHMEEHSVEVELPFLQYIYGDGWRLVPIVAKDATPRIAREMAEAIAAAAERLGRKILFIASSDFTHHGYMYGYVVFTENIRENVAKLDMSIIEKILKLDTNGFLSRIVKTGATVCGYATIAVLIEYTKHRGGKMRLLKYYNSADVTGDEEIVVGYAAILAHR
jgi:AmmeMemoRadiSam system protein B